MQLAFADLAGISVTSMEIERGGNSYTIDTVDALQAADPDRAVFVIVGGDIAPHLDTWHRADELRRRCTIAVYDRPGSGGLPPEGWVVEHLALPQLDVSSTDVRSRCAAGLPIDGLVPPAVAQYLRAHPLYAPTQAVAGR